jgi:hypothetical protein
MAEARETERRTTEVFIVMVLRECGELERKLTRVKECGWEVQVSECIEVIER